MNHLHEADGRPHYALHSLCVSDDAQRSWRREGIPLKWRADSVAFDDVIGAFSYLHSVHRDSVGRHAELYRAEVVAELRDSETLQFKTEHRFRLKA